LQGYLVETKNPEITVSFDKDIHTNFVPGFCRFVSFKGTNQDKFLPAFSRKGIWSKQKTQK